jgi:TatD DNase family protein
MLIDTHAHIHFDSYDEDVDAVIGRATEAGVERIICVGVDAVDSATTVKFVENRDNCYATVGLHPHEAAKGRPALDKIAELVTSPKVVAVGECGLDYFRNLSPRSEQEAALRFQIELAIKHDKALVFHIRDAFPDFFRIVDDYEIKRAVVHCFTAGVTEMHQSIDRGFYVALNGIMTFTKDELQLEAAKNVPLDKLVLETDCPFLTPAPKRGQRNEPANVALTAAFLANLRGEPLAELSAATSQNALRLFNID